MKKALIWAYTQVNLGDDLFVKVLCERYPNVIFSIIGKKKKLLPFKNISNLRTVSDYYSTIDSAFRKLGYRTGFYNNKIRKNAQNEDVVINIGGSIFMEFPDWQKNICDYKKVVDNSSKFVVVGSNFGPFKSRDFLLKYEAIFKDLNDVCFRDKRSFKLFENLSNVRCSPDVVFELDTSKICASKKSNGYVLISVMDFSFKSELSCYKKNYEDNLVKICSFLISKKLKIKLMSFCKEEGDEEMISRIKAKFLNNSSISSYCYRGDIDEALSIIKSSSSIVATRFHSMILALVFQKPFYPIVYSEKMTNVLEDINFKGNYSMLGDSIDCQCLYNQLTSLPFEFKKKEQLSQFSYLDSILLD